MLPALDAAASPLESFKPPVDPSCEEPVNIRTSPLPVEAAAERMLTVPLLTSPVELPLWTTTLPPVATDDPAFTLIPAPAPELPRPADS
jgi:hypothetical protein